MSKSVDLTITYRRTFSGPDRITTCDDKTITLTRSGYRDVADLQAKARQRWHDPKHKTVTNTPQGVRVDYIKPHSVTIDGWTLRTTTEEIEVRS